VSVSQKMKLNEAGVTLIDCDHKTPAAQTSGYPYIGIPQLKNGHIRLDGARLISEEDFVLWTKKAKPKHNDVILSRRCNPGESAYVPEGLEIALGQNLVLLRSDGSVIYPPFLRWLVQGNEWWEQVNKFLNVGAVFDSLKCKDIPNFNLTIPSLKEQKRITDILSSLDNKIELNNKVNQTLESITQAIFKSWFIDFDPVRAKIAAKQNGEDPELAAMCAISGKSEAELEQIAKEDFAELQATAALFPDELVESELGVVPKGWVVSIVGEQVQTVGGGTPSTKNADFWDNGIHHWTTPKDLSNLTDKILLNTERKITDIGLKKISSGLLPKNTVLMSSRAPVGYLALAKIEVAINQGYIAILPNTKYSAEYLIHWCKANMAEIKGRASGTTFQEISKKNFREINFISPDEKVIAVYTRTAKTLYDEITLKAKEKQSLINLRDTLLPKLLLGEVEIPDFINEGE
jgi:type I restriction enzyme S subunit